MSITKRDPNTIWLGGEGVQVNDVVAEEAITPGMLIELHNASGTGKYRKHATSGGVVAPIFALDQSMLNKGVDDAYAAGDLVEALHAQPGTTIWALIPSGQNVAAGAELMSAGTGKLTAKTSTNYIVAHAEFAADNSAGPSDMRVRVVVR